MTTRALAPTLIGQGARIPIRNFGTSLLFNGSSADVAIPNHASLNSANLTVMAWINPYSLEVDDYLNNVICKEGSNSGFVLRIGSGAVSFMVGNGGTPQAKDSAPSIKKGVWSLITGTYDGTNIKVYLNADLKATTGASNHAFSTDTLFLGRYTGGGRYFHGLMDNVYYYSEALTLEQIQSVYYSGDYPTANLVSKWLCNEGSGTDVLDGVSTNHGVNTNATYSNDVVTKLRTAG